MVLPQLETPRTILRELDEDDVPALLTLFGFSDELARFDIPRLHSSLVCMQWLDKCRRDFSRRSTIVWGIESRVSMLLVGLFICRDVGKGRGEVFGVINRTHQGKGLMTEVAKLMKVLLPDLGLQTVEGFVNAGDEAAIALFQHCGAVCSGSEFDGSSKYRINL